MFCAGSSSGLLSSELRSNASENTNDFDTGSTQQNDETIKDVPDSEQSQNIDECEQLVNFDSELNDDSLLSEELLPFSSDAALWNMDGDLRCLQSFWSKKG